jgi:hypothetical protein
MLGLWSLGSAPMGLSLHVAFRASLGDVLDACDALRASGVTPLSLFGAEATEPSVIAWMPAAAVYFRDPRRPPAGVPCEARRATTSRPGRRLLVTVGRGRSVVGCGPGSQCYARVASRASRPGGALAHLLRVCRKVSHAGGRWFSARAGSRVRSSLRPAGLTRLLLGHHQPRKNERRPDRRRPARRARRAGACSRGSSRSRRTPADRLGTEHRIPR